MYYILEEKDLKKIMKQIRKDQDFSLWTFYAKYSCMKIKKIILSNVTRRYEDIDYDIR